MIGEQLVHTIFVNNAHTSVLDIITVKFLVMPLCVAEIVSKCTMGNFLSSTAGWFLTWAQTHFKIEIFNPLVLSQLLPYLYILYKHNPLSIIYCISLDMQPVHVISMSWGPPSCPYRSQLTTPARATHLSIQVVGSRSSSNTGDGSLLLAVTILAY